jgi:hypothetical protein
VLYDSVADDRSWVFLVTPMRGRSKRHCECHVDDPAHAQPHRRQDQPPRRRWIRGEDGRDQRSVRSALGFRCVDSYSTRTPSNRPTDSPQSCDSDMTMVMIPMIPLADSSTTPLRTTAGECRSSSSSRAGGSQVEAVGSQAGVEDKSSISSGEVEERFACMVFFARPGHARCIAASGVNVVTVI